MDFHCSTRILGIWQHFLHSYRCGFILVALSLDIFVFVCSSCCFFWYFPYKLIFKWLRQKSQSFLSLVFPIRDMLPITAAPVPFCSHTKRWSVGHSMVSTSLQKKYLQRLWEEEVAAGILFMAIAGSIDVFSQSVGPSVCLSFFSEEFKRQIREWGCCRLPQDNKNILCKFLLKGLNISVIGNVFEWICFGEGERNKWIISSWHSHSLSFLDGLWEHLVLEILWQRKRGHACGCC